MRIFGGLLSDLLVGVGDALLLTGKNDKAAAPSLFGQLLKYIWSPSEFQKQGEALLTNRFEFINAKMEEAFTKQVEKCYYAFDRVYFYEHIDEYMDGLKEGKDIENPPIADLNAIAQIYERAVLDFSRCQAGIAAGCLYQLGLPKAVVEYQLASPILVDIQEDSDPEACLENLIQQAPPNQTQGIQQLISKTNEVVQKYQKHALSQDGRIDIQANLNSDISRMLESSWKTLAVENYTIIHEKLEQALQNQAERYYQASIQVYQAERKNLQNRKTQIDLKSVGQVVEKAFQDLFDSSREIYRGCFLQLGIPRKMVVGGGFEHPIPLSVQQISNPETCLGYFTGQAPLQTPNIQQLIAKTEEICQRRKELCLSENCGQNTRIFVNNEINDMIIRICSLSSKKG
jgi:hypothetical protein